VALLTVLRSPGPVIAGRDLPHICRPQHPRRCCRGFLYTSEGGCGGHGHNRGGGG
jgi:hypothetical protein